MYFSYLVIKVHDISEIDTTYIFLGPTSLKMIQKFDDDVSNYHLVLQPVSNQDKQEQQQLVERLTASTL